MSSNSYGLQQIKKELQQLSSVQLADLCIRLARYKKENKELLAYLLFQAHDEQAFATEAKAETDSMFQQLPSHSYQAAKALRKILRLINKYSKFTASKTFELDVTIHFCQNYLSYVDKRASYKPLRMILIRQVQKALTTLKKLPEDLQFDYRPELERLIAEADNKLSWFNKNDYSL